MAKLSKEEAAMLKRLQDKSEAPDAPSVGRALNVTVDLGDDKQVKRAIKLGLIPDPDEEAGGEDDDDDDDAEETPRRRGFFGDA